MLGGNSSIIHNTMIHNNSGVGVYIENTALDMKGCTLSNNVYLG